MMNMISLHRTLPHSFPLRIWLSHLPDSCLSCLFWQAVHKLPVFWAEVAWTIAIMMHDFYIFLDGRHLDR